MRLGKRGELTTKEIVEIVLAAGAVLVVAVLLYALISPVFDRVDKTSESYFDTFLEQVGVADSGGVGSFLIWSKEEEVKYYLVYFGGSKWFSKGESVSFSSLGENLNRICICSLEGGVDICNYCENLDLPILSDYASEGYTPWAVGVGERLIIKKGEERYEFLTSNG